MIAVGEIFPLVTIPLSHIPLVLEKRGRIRFQKEKADVLLFVTSQFNRNGGNRRWAMGWAMGAFCRCVSSRCLCEANNSVVIGGVASAHVWLFVTRRPSHIPRANLRAIGSTWLRGHCPIFGLGLCPRSARSFVLKGAGVSTSLLEVVVGAVFD